MPSISQSGIRIAIDRGGTFCDFWASVPGSSEDIVFKLLSVSPEEYNDAPTEGIRQILERATGRPLPRGQPIPLEDVESIRMGTTVATNALLERKGRRVALVTTKGLRDLLVIGTQARPHIFDLSVEKLDQLYERVLEVDERVTFEAAAEDPNSPQIDMRDPELTICNTGEVIRIIQKPNMDVIRQDLESLWLDGFRDLAIAFIHSYAYPDHELAVAEMARSLGFNISVSCQLQPSIKIVTRAQSAVADAYLSPITAEYLQSFAQGFKGQLQGLHSNKLLISQSDGGLTTFNKFTGLRAILSGPAGGVVGFSKTCYDADEGTPVIGFDMGGTSTDVSRFGGSLEYTFESTVAEVTIQSPQLDINTVAAGGGSILAWRNGLFNVGPESAGAHPGPACYGKGGPLTVTDANLFLGRIIPSYFPRRLDHDIVSAKFEHLTTQINIEKRTETKVTTEEVAMGFLSVANAAMTRPIRALSEGRGYETAGHNLASFGGAGGQHAVAIARDLGIRRILIHKYSSILSAYGMALADVIVEMQEPTSLTFDGQAQTEEFLQGRFKSLQERVDHGLREQGFDNHNIEHERFLNMRYQGTDTALMTAEPSKEGETFADAFVARHKREFGFIQQREILVDDIRVKGVGRSQVEDLISPFAELESLLSKAVHPKSSETCKVYLEHEGWRQVPLYLLGDLERGCELQGPAMILDKTQTILLDSACRAKILREHVLIDLVDVRRKEVDTQEVDPILLSVFGHRFMSVAEQMGQTLQKTSVSTNIKERLDYSCAVFSAAGGLVANAPHIPGHLGSMSTAISYQANRYKKGELKRGDVLLSNHPIAGGTHLPDLTVTTPIFAGVDIDNLEILFFVASRGHHADIGGITAGSMPPNSTELWQEGVAVESFKMVKEGVFDEEGLRKILFDEPASHPGCSGSRNLKDNIADLKAAVAANEKGIQLVNTLVREYTWPVVRYYMEAIQSNAEMAVRTLLKDFSKRFQGKVLWAIDYMDDGTPLELSVRIDATDGSAVFDFTGTGLEAMNNLNTPIAVTVSAIIYCLRCMLMVDIPLNQGCLAPIKVICPDKSLLAPNLKAATVASNTETSQRLIDLIFNAFQVCGASQGTSNNLTFGYGGKGLDSKVTQGFGYYESIGGGSGAGADWQGQSGSHVHFTNTRMTDPETLERRYPVLLREFAIRRGSGGAGRNRGGDGLIRDIEMRRAMEVNVLSERRVFPPYGMRGGKPGQRGLNLWIRHYEHEGPEATRTINMGGKAKAFMNKGDRIIVMTPGGGGYGKDPNEVDAFELEDEFRLFDAGRKNKGNIRGSVADKLAAAQSN
ncbi:hypothetical protein LTR10_017627 [Elasticomyces elasticus]|uniref:5-oxoprolinase n=1 Tax=Exophiala sideris TaxID=1016849 RepID=A0ABR0JR07_9EURO|nr:hypothetical protein LTR10_017627 [Elasticomyces elasticus]KAK5038272.1 hypothetical protein LTS07_001742 [Exophiala sideris]KAK5044256.1 hypothetical protein LTR13_000612 [Exophiala sideris]KAK5067756.1 hypothetical protein LTR69_001745 [Exophiala sideris]KAK5184004.1 hypothetical protein LTR44_003509 [Eurotiomycetes sp. CCFEE 6388]